MELNEWAQENHSAIEVIPISLKEYIKETLNPILNEIHKTGTVLL